jgi:hypothetical protein
MDPACTDEEACADLGVREPVAGQHGDLSFLRREVVAARL